MIRWSTLVADDSGIIDYPRVRSLVSVILATLGGVAAVWVIFLVREVNETLVGIVVAALVAPLTGGKIGDAIAQRKASKETARVVAGQAPGRRASDSAVVQP